MTGTRRRALALTAGTLAAVGCVDRRFVIESNAPAAQAFVDGNPVGLTPADGRWEYAGYRTIQVVAPGYEPVTQRVRFEPKWHNIPPLDLFAEVLYPFRIEDVRRVRIDLPPAQPVNQAALVESGNALRAVGKGMRESVIPDTPAPRPAAAPLPQLPPVPAVERQIPGNLFQGAVPTDPTVQPGGGGAQPGSVPAGPGTAPGR